MDPYVTGETIRSLREKCGLTQSKLALSLSVTPKAVSRWECGHGYPDITLLPSLAEALHVSVPELLQGKSVINTNVSGSVRRGAFRVCPVCGNVIYSLGEVCISCCGISLPPLSGDPADEDHPVHFEPVEDELFLSVSHEMTREHHISFLACVSSSRVTVVKLYPEGAAEARFKREPCSRFYLYCNRHGLLSVSAPAVL